MPIKTKKFRDFGQVDKEDHELERIEELCNLEAEEIEKSTKLGEIQ